jgi:hypothetical protein
MSGKDRERVLIEMLGGQVTLIVPTLDLASDVRPATRNRLRSVRETFSWHDRARLRQANARSI